MVYNLAQEIDHRSGEFIELCYHCHKCTAGCPVVDAMEYGPDQILRMIALNQCDDVLQSKDIWLCAGCFTCATRCPNDIDISAVMDSLRQVALEQGYKIGEPDTLLFHRIFMGVVSNLGRSHEAFSLGLFKVLSHVPLLNDMDSGVNLFVRGKVPIFPKQTKARQQVRQIIQRSK
jgi:heterodisulfide reductase subunit C